MAYEITENPLRGVEARLGSGHYGVFDHGAHIWAYQPDGQAPVLWMSAKSWFTDGQPIRGGVPVIFPWFGTGPRGDLQPAHAFARLSTWHLSDIKDTLDRDGRLLVEYELDDAMTGSQEHFPYDYTAYLRAKFTPEYLGITLTMTNDGDEPFTFENALHTYLVVGDVRQVSVTGLEGATYLDKVAGQAGLVQDGAVTITGETDRVYDSRGEVVLHDPVLGRTLVVSKSGSDSTVVWNPWVAKSAAMPDFGDDEWTGMICIEAANALDKAITLLPGQTHQLKQRITLA